MKSYLYIGKKVSIREITEDDIPVFWEYIYGTGEPEWKKWDAPYFPLAPMSLEDYRIHMRMVLEVDPAPRMVIEIDGEIAGQVSYYWEDRDSHWLEAGIVIYDSKYWNGGYGTEALSIWVEHLFQSLPLVRVGITTWSGNKRMMRAAEKIGMKLEGRMRKCRFYNGEYYDSIRMGILREEWREKKESQLL
ncbi:MULTISPECIES: GNAT family N-acetyltransferase [Bacillus]|uniref:GNAT family N-acetyltransferase n=1 Tax=Bacillus TaxID=1386 RepID=UPI0015E072D6|nr:MULTISPECIES: GNAT family protein [Bacillus]